MLKKAHLTLRTSVLLVITAALILSGCQIDNLVPSGVFQREKKITIEATYEIPEMDTKTVRDDNAKIYWTPGDAISLFFGSGTNGGSRFIAQNDDVALKTTFSGSITAVTGGSDIDDEDTYFWGLYPYDETASCDGQTVTMRIPSIQIGKEGSFAPGMAPSLGRSQKLAISFRNIWSGFGFTVSEYGYRSITFRGNGGEYLAGKAKIGIDENGLPKVVEILDGVQEVTLIAPESWYGFVPGKYYYIQFFPETFTTGFTVELVSATQIGTYVYSESMDYPRSTWKRAANVDTRVDEWRNRVVSEAGGMVDLVFFSDKECHVVIPDEAKSWITFVSKDMDSNKQTVTVEVHANIGAPRNTTLLVQSEDGSINWPFDIEQVSGHDYELAVERAALLAIYNALDGDNWTNNDNWCSNKPICEWYGVGVDEDGFISSLCLSDNNLNGSLPDEIWDLTFTTGIDLGDNPNLTGELSERIGNMKRLNYLEFDYCNLSGQLPKNLYLCEVLYDINIHANNISGNIPKEYVSLFNRVSVCDFAANNLSGVIPQEIMDSEYFVHCWADITAGNALQLPRKMIFPQWEAIDINGSYISSSIFRQNKLTLMVNCAWLNNVQCLYQIYEDYHSKGLEIISFDYSSYAGSASLLKEQAEEANLPWPCFYSLNAFKGLRNNWSTYPTYGFMGGGWTLVNSNGEVVESSYLGGDGAILNAIRKEFSEDNATYFSTDYSQHLQCEYLQIATKGKGIPIILMGDGYSDLSIASGKYMNDMRIAYNSLFSVEPFASFKDYFTVSVVKLVSLVDGFETEYSSALECWFNDANNTTTIGITDFSALDQDAKYGMGDYDTDIATVGVILNSDKYAGRSALFYPNATSTNIGNGLSVAFISGPDEDAIESLVHHDLIGHCFAKLADEWADENAGAFSLEWDLPIYQLELSYGWYQNIDFTNDYNLVKWNQFISDERYASENIGCYEGAMNYFSTGVWRPTENSIMRNNTGGFNAPSRYAIWYRINKLAYGDDWNGTYEDFVAYDAVNRTSAATAQTGRNYVLKQLPPLAPPVVVGHSWQDAK